MPHPAATLLGLLVFRQRVRGAYFAILSQALLYAFVIYIDANQLQIGGKTGLTGLKEFFGLKLADRNNQRLLYYVSAAVLLVSIGLSKPKPWEVRRDGSTPCLTNQLTTDCARFLLRLRFIAAPLLGHRSILFTSAPRRKFKTLAPP